MFRILLFLVIAGCATAAEFSGWEGLRVLPVEGSVTASETGDVNGDGRESLFIANRRQSRIDIYNWLPPEKRKKADTSDSPNELPMAPDFERSEIILERPPFDIKLKNLDDDKELELIILTTLPLKLHRYDFKDGKWQESESWPLPNTDLQSLSLLSYKNSIFISTQKGVLMQELVKNAQSEWMKPLESGIRRLNWWIHDIDLDGEEDLVDLIVDSSERARFRWFKNNGKEFLPAIPLGDIKATYGLLDESAKQPTFFFHNPVRNNTVNEYIIEKGEETEIGRNRIIPRLNIRDDAVTTVKINDKKLLVEIDPERPMMRVSQLTESGFTQIGNFPILRKTKAVTAPVGKDFLLMQVGDSSDLYISRWQKGRFSYPEVYNEKESEEEKKLLGLGRHADSVWWIQAVGDSLFLNVWSSGKEKFETEEFKGIAKGLDQAYWIGGKSIMVRKKYAKYASFYSLKDSKATLVEAPHLKDATESQFHFFKVKSNLKMARIVDGILQWYGDNLQPVDQVMLENGDKIIAACYSLSGSMYVLDQSGEKIHEFKEDESGMMKEQKSFEVLASTDIRNDEILGLVLENNLTLNAVAKGSPLKLKLKNSISEKLGLPVGVKNAAINSFRLQDVSGDKRNEVLFTDFNRHQLTLIDISGEAPAALASWKVFDDGKYPYSDGTGGSAGGGRNPYMTVSLDLDGDGIKELVLGCHDRLLIYVGREVKK